ncbi:uncharacterized protein LOC133214106 [Neopsephotus bourkii]|uniref:uncharacterized protein LOC133214106 n=1 Tax=Neopsephotus bourkii TaxID=309878 RepID=UPI002AA54DF7|nr:uncharacterized protein LOC133214106 [Neopsephotus bourkii]
MAEYLHLDSSLLTLLQYTDLAHRGLQSPTVLVEDTGHIDFTVNHYVGLSWPVKCGAFVMLHEFIQVLQQNIDSHHLSELLGYEIAGWRILRRGDYERKSPGQQRRRLMITPTPTLKPITITQRLARGDASRPLSSTVPSCLLTQLVITSTQGLSSFCEESITTASYKMENNIHLIISQESLVTLEMNSVWDMPAKPPVSIMFADSNFPDLSPSLTTKTSLFFTELEVRPTRASDTSLLLEQLENYMPETDSYFLYSKTEVSTYRFLQDITSDRDQLSRPTYTWVINTLYEQLQSSADILPSKKEFHVFLPEAASVSEMTDYTEEAKSHFPELEMLSSASFSPGLPSLFPKASARATTSSDITFPIDDTFPLVLASSSLSQVFAKDYEQLFKPFMTIPQPSGFPFAVTQREAQTLEFKLNFSPQASACFSSMLYSTFPSKAEESYEPSLITLSHPNTTPVLTLPVDFSSFDTSELSRPPNRLNSYSGNILRTEIQSASILSSSTKELKPDRDLGTWILSNTTNPTLKSHKISDIKLDAVEVPLVTLFNAPSQLSSSISGVVQTLLPSYQNPSALLSPTSERLQQSMESTWILPSFSFSQELQNITAGKKFTSMLLLLNIAVINLFIHHAKYFWIPILEPMQTSKYFDLKIHILLN